MAVTRKKRSEMSADELKQYNAEAKRRSRDRQAIAKGEASFGTLVKSWDRHELQLKEDDPEKHARYLQRHNEVELAEQELQDIRFAAEKLNGFTWDDVCDPLITLRDIRALSQHGELNYREVEAAMGGGEWPLVPKPIGDLTQYRHQKSFEGNEPAEAYRTYGFRLVLDSNSLADAEKFAEQFKKETQVPSPPGSNDSESTEGPSALSM